MKRQLQNQVRRSFRTFGRKLSRFRDRAATYVRSRSSDDETRPPLRILPVTPRILDDTDHDTVFDSSEDVESSEEDTEPPPTIYIPCEFCQVQQVDHRLNRHQSTCPQNPNSVRRRRNSSSNGAPRRPYRRAASASAAIVVPSAPPRSRSPSLTRGYPVPISLTCPITHSIFRDPVVASDGYTYERDAILNWLRVQSRQESPVTRELISRDRINPNRLIKGLVDKFIAECQEKSLRYKYRLDVHLKKTTPEPFIKTGTKSVYHAEWITDRSSTAKSSKIILIHFTGEHAEQLSETYYALPPHPNIVPILGRVEHQESGILLVQEYSPTQTLSQLLSQPNQKFPIAILDAMIYQIASAFEHLEKTNVTYTKMSTDHFLVYHLDDRTDKTSIKLINIDITNESNELSSNTTHMQAFGELIQELYGLELEKARERQILFRCCVASDPNDRPTLNQVIDRLSHLIDEKNM